MFLMSIRRLNFVIAARQIGVVDSRTIFMKTCFTKLTDDTYTLMNRDLFKQTYPQVTEMLDAPYSTKVSC